jgi:hypothetical protein
VKTLTDYFDPRALSVHVFNDGIPDSRLTENRVEYSISPTFAVFKNYLNLLEVKDADSVYISVSCNSEATPYRHGGSETGRCEADGSVCMCISLSRSRAHTHRILAEHVEAELENDRPSRGEVCPGDSLESRPCPMRHGDSN